MDQTERRRKRVEEPGTSTGRRHPAVSTGVSSGELKGKPLAAGEPSGLTKPPLAAARRSADHAERAASSRKELPLPTESDRGADAHGGRSLRLRLSVEGERITVLDAIEVDVPAPQPQRVRGTDFLEVRAGDEVLALQPLIDPGIAVGIPDSRDTTEFRGHREVELEAYELTVRVPLDAVESLVSREVQGSPDQAARREPVPVEITVYRASANLVIEPGRFGTDRAARGDLLARVATTGRLSLDELRGAARGNTQRKPDDPKGRSGDTG